MVRSRDRRGKLLLGSYDVTQLWSMKDLRKGSFFQEQVELGTLNYMRKQE